MLTQVHQEHGHQRVERCLRCQVVKDVHPKSHNAKGNLLASCPNEILAIDYTIPEPTQNGLENVLVLTDVFSKYTMAFPTWDQRVATMARVLVTEWFYKFGVPGCIQIRATTSKVFSSNSCVTCTGL